VFQLPLRVISEFLLGCWRIGWREKRTGDLRGRSVSFGGSGWEWAWFGNGGFVACGRDGGRHHDFWGGHGDMKSWRGVLG
jgi:hypothetical protein